MGAVGWAIFLGYNAAQIDSIFRTTNFDEVINDFIQGPQKTFMRKKRCWYLVFTFQAVQLLIPQALSKGLCNFNLPSRLLEICKAM
jgi:NTE family protein